VQISSFVLSGCSYSAQLALRLEQLSANNNAFVEETPGSVPLLCDRLGRDTEMLRAGVGLPAVMKLLGHTSPEMTMQYLDVTLNDLERAFELARSKPRHLVPQPRVTSAPLREGLDGVIDSLLATQHVLEMFRRALPNGTSRHRLDRLSNRLTKILIEARKLATP
jgi:hypothetical protein